MTNGVNGNIVGNGGTGSLSLASILQPLADNGGNFLTHALAAGSLAIDAGNNAFARELSGTAFTTDQRGIGFLRTNNETVDMGAFEV